MRPAAGGRQGAGSIAKIVGGHGISNESHRVLQARNAPWPHRPALIRFTSTAAGLDRLADHALHLGRHAEAERLAHRAAEMR